MVASLQIHLLRPDHTALAPLFDRRRGIVVYPGHMKRGEKTATGGRVRWNVLFTPEEVAFLREQARREGKTAADVVRAALNHVYRPAESLDPLRALDELVDDYLPPLRVHEALRRLTSGGES